MRLKVVWRDGWAYAHGTGPDGGRVRRALQTRDPRRAEEARATLEARLWKLGLYGASHVVTFDECALAYAEDGGDTRFLVKITQQLSGMRLRDITPNEVRAAARRAYPNAAPATQNRQGITPAKAVINYGHAQGWCAPIRVRAFPVARPVRKAVGAGYLEALRPALPLRLYALMLFLHQTGRRVGDAIGLTPDNLDLRQMRAFIPRTKNGDPAVVYLTSELAELLTAINPRHGRVFGYASRSSVYSTLRRACTKTGVEYLGTHQPGRHSYATTLSEHGWSSKAIAEVGGWKSVRLVAETYEHPETDGERAARVFDTKMTQSNKNNTA